MSKSKRGFTLVEMVIVIGIIGVIGTFLANAILGAQRSGRDAKRKADVEQIRSALEMYRSNNTLSRYPVFNPLPGQTCSNMPGLAPQYIAQIPRDPSRGRNYYCFSDGTTYIVRTSLELSVAACGTGCGLPCRLQVGPYGTTCGP